jgi:uncharacterized protein
MQTWVVKLSKFCNMRCSYCYEWNELSDPTRMSMDVWRKLLRAIIRLREIQIQSWAQRKESRVLVVLHGGEPLALPTPYLREALALFSDVKRHAQGDYHLGVQSNLYSVSDDKIDLLREHGASISFSYDVVPGVRLNLARKPTESRVLENIDKLRSRGIRVNGIAVLAKHTAAKITDVYDFYAARNMGMRILPLFDGPPDRPAEDFVIDHRSVIQAQERLFRHWMETGCRVPIAPFDTYFHAALRHMAGLRLRPTKRGKRGDGVMVVNVDGSVYRVLDAYEADRALGSIATQTVDDILSSDAFQRSVVRDDEEFEKRCASCTYRTSCGGGHIYDSRSSFPYEGPCVTAYHCIDFMQRYIREQGFADADIRDLLELTKRNEAAATSAAI